MASIKKRSVSSYLLTVSCGYDKQGKKITKTRTVNMSDIPFKRRDAEAERQAILFEEEIKKGHFVDNERLTFAEFTDKWLSDYADINLQPKTLHVGTDFSGNIYNGALDNASGVSFVYQMAEYIKDLGQPKGDVYLVLFNGEEGGFLGSYDFCVNHYAEIKNGKVINFDMIGSTSVPLCIMTAEKDSPEEGFAKEMSKICKNYKLNFNYLYQNASDHTPFREAGIDAVTFCDDDTSKIHTPDDKINIIDKEGGERCFKVVSKEILNYEYNDDIIFYADYLIIAASALIIILLALLVRNKRREFK